MSTPPTNAEASAPRVPQPPSGHDIIPSAADTGLEVAPGGSGGEDSGETTGVVDAIVKRLSSPSEDAFHAGLALLSASRELSAGRGKEIILSLSSVWLEQGVVTSRLQAERLRTIFTRVLLVAVTPETLVDLAPALPPHLKNTVAEVLPSELRPALFHIPRATDRSQTRDSGPSCQKSDEGTATGPEGHESADPVGSSSEIEGEREEGPDAENTSSERISPFTTVLLLSLSEYQEANKNLLTEEGFGPLVWTSVGRLKDDIGRNTDVCGFVVDQSILRDLDAEQQVSLFETLSSYSTIAHIRVDARGLKLSPEGVRAVLRRTRCMGTSVPHELLSIQQDGNLRGSEISEFRRASNVLGTFESARFIPGELSSEESWLLVSAVRAHLESTRFDESVSIESIETRFLAGGFSHARIAVLRVGKGGRPLVAKIASKAAILEEISRFRTFIQPVDDQLRPEVYFHGEAALILFALVENPDDRGRPADTLEDTLNDMWNAQLFDSLEPSDSAWSLEAGARALERIASKLADLNLRGPTTGQFPKLGNPTHAHLIRLEESGFDWGLGSAALSGRRAASERFTRLSACGTVHGDIHLRNILVRGESDAHLIDYASCGPGHPGIDLVRLEMALYCQGIRVLESEEQCCAFQRRLSLSDATVEDLSREFPASFDSCHVNRACLRGMVAARDRSLQVIQHYGGDLDDYISTKYLVAWQNLGMPGRNTSLARATILALGDHANSLHRQEESIQLMGQPLQTPSPSSTG